MKKRILSILLLCCMALTLFPTAVFAAGGEAAALSPDTGSLCEHHPEHDEACGYTPQTADTAGAPCGHMCEICESGDGGADPADPAGTSGAAMPRTRGGAVRPAATQYTYTLHYDANGGSGAPPSQSVTSSEFHVWVPISEIIPTRDGYTFMGWANSRTGKPIYGGSGGYTSCLVVHGYDMSTTIYAIWEVHNHNWGEWTSNGNGTHTRTCATDSSHTETGSCSGGKATGTEKAICETCHTAYGELLPLIKTVITTPPTLPAEGHVGDEYLDEALKGGEAKVEGTDIVVPGSFRFKHNWGGVVGPGENRMEILFTPDDAETYATAECIVTVTGLKHTITSVTEEVLPDEPLGTAFEYLGLPHFVEVKTNTGATFGPIPVTWDGSTYDPNKYGEQIITGELHVEESFYEEELEPTSTVKAIARITLIDDGAIVPTLEPPTYSRQIYSGDFCQLAFSDEYLSGGTATADGETVPGVFTLNEEQEKYGYWHRGGGLVQVGPLALKVTFTPYDRLRFSTAECTVNVDVIPRKFRQANTSYIDNKKIGTAFEDLGLPNAFYFFAEADEPNHEGSGLNGNVPGIIKWDDSSYDPNSYEEQTIYGEVNRAEFEKYYIVPEGADLRGVVKVTLQADPVETEITQPPVFRWKNGDFTLPDNTMFVNRIFEMGATGGESANLADGVAKVKGTDTVVPGTFSFKEGTPGWFDTLGENIVTVVFTPADQRGYRKAETTIKVNVIKNTFKRCEEPDPITEKKLGTTFAGLNLPEIVVVEAIDGLRVGMEVSWEESSYDAQSTAWQTIPGTLVFDANDEHKYQQPDPAVTAKIRVKLLGSEDAPAITTTTLPGGTVGTPYHHQLQATGGGFILWELFSGALPEGLTLKQTTGEISGTPTAEGTAQFTVRALNSVGNDKKELSITIAKDAPVEYAVTVTNDGNGTAFASPAKAAAGTEIALTAAPKEGYHFKEWQVISGGVTIKDDKFTMPDSNVEVKAIFEKDAPSAGDLVDPVVRIIPTRGGMYFAQQGTRTAADFFKPGEVPKGAKITAITPPASPSILDSISVDNDGLLSYAKNEADGEQLKTDVYTVTITSDDYAPITAPLTVRQYLFAGFRAAVDVSPWVYGDTRTYKWKAINPGENGTWSAIMREQGIFEIYEETVDTTSEPGVSHYTTKVRAIKAGRTFIDILYVSDTTASWSPWTHSSVFAGDKVVVRGLTVTAGSATITKGDALPTDLVSCTGLLDSEGRTDDRDTVLDNALSYRLLDADGAEVTVEAARNTPGTYTVVPAATLKSGWDERYSLNRVNGTLTVEDKVEELFTVTVTSGGNGTASASPAKAAAGTEIALTAAPDKGYRFKAWQVISGNVTIKDDKFLMPNDNVEVKAIFEKDAPPAPTEFIVTFDGNGGTPSVGSMTTTDQKLAALPSASRSGSYSFDGWYTEKNGGTKVTTATVFSANTTVYAHWIYTGGSNGCSDYTITAIAGAGGTISPSGKVSVREGRDQTFTITPDKGYAVSNVKIDGQSIGAVKSYTFATVSGPHTIEVIFMKANGNPQTGVLVDTAADSCDADAADGAVKNGRIEGAGDTTGSPDAISSRTQIVTFLRRTAGSPAPEIRTMLLAMFPWADPAYNAVLRAVENGIT
ncbi:InlB B-repeat-containing protein [Yeguia hominis]|uniref:InlB B-repeat-containing protein n=1 Tax=Yeguia hominis TaxID=2763662 RepID=A0A926DAP6_9FIRM|nr:InlB B-repeat-containing protein [Yeguia hominis]MBC8533490.1 InlB B-repeat-containing protein [Yeguia hominis]